MKEFYEKTLQMIKILNIKNEKDYYKLMENYLLLSIDSLKYISGTKKFKKIISIANKQY